MSYQAAKESYAAEIAEIKAAGLWKTERVIASDQKNDITLEGGANVVNMCANNYLGLANNAEVMQAVRGGDVMMGHDPDCTSWIRAYREPAAEGEGRGCLLYTSPSPRDS